MADKEIEPLLTKADLVRILQLSSRTLDRMRSTGAVPRHDLMLGKGPRWRASTIRRWLESGAIKADKRPGHG
jgi:predicted DNA-binding transcriptional regulator AlpA